MEVLLDSLCFVLTKFGCVWLLCSGLKTCFENVEGIYSGKYRSYVHGLVTDLADTQRKLADKTEQLEVRAELFCPCM